MQGDWHFVDLCFHYSIFSTSPYWCWTRCSELNSSWTQIWLIVVFQLMRRSLSPDLTVFTANIQMSPVFWLGPIYWRGWTWTLNPALAITWVRSGQAGKWPLWMIWWTPAGASGRWSQNLATLGEKVHQTIHRNTNTVQFLLYTARSQHAEIENSHSQRGKSEQALLKLYSNFFSHPPEAR